MFGRKVNDNISEGVRKLQATVDELANETAGSIHETLVAVNTSRGALDLLIERMDKRFGQVFGKLDAIIAKLSATAKAPSDAPVSANVLQLDDDAGAVPRAHWSPEEDKVLSQYAPAQRWVEASQKLGVRSPGSCRHRWALINRSDDEVQTTRNIELHPRYGAPWSEGEDEVLRSFPDAPIEELALLLPGRTHGAIYERSARVNGRRPRRSEAMRSADASYRNKHRPRGGLHWTADEEEEVRNIPEAGDFSRAARKLGRTEDAVKAKWWRLHGMRQ